MNKIVIAIMIFMASSGSILAAEYSGKVKGLYVNKTTLIMTSLDTTTSACGDANWPFELHMSDPVANRVHSQLIKLNSLNPVETRLA